MPHKSNLGKKHKKHSKKLEIIKRLFKGFLMSLVVIFLLLLIFLGLALYLLSRPPELAKEIRPVEVTEEKALAFDNKYQTFKVALDQAQPNEPVSLTLSEAEVSSYLSKVIQERKLPGDTPVEVKGKAQVNFTEGRVLALADAGIYGVTAKVAVKAKVEVDPEGNLKVEVEEVDFGRAPVPEDVPQRIKDFVQEKSQELNELPINLESIQLQDGQLVLSGIKR